MKILITGANGFVAKNLIVALEERQFATEDILTVTRETTSEELSAKVLAADFIFHLAGENRPQKNDDFYKNNTDLTKNICDVLVENGKRTDILFTSSIQVELPNDYGKSKKLAEDILIKYSEKSQAEVFIYRLPNIFGKWSKPNYNSVVATFCYNAIRGIPIQNNSPGKLLSLAYIDHVVEAFLETFEKRKLSEVQSIFKITLDDLEKKIKEFGQIRKTLVVPPVGSSITRALYATYLSFLPKEEFTHDLTKNSDPRGTFVEVLKTEDSGQFSFFTAHPGVTRGGHYHHTKNEKFLVVRGRACFKFKHLITKEQFEVITESNRPQIVETVPGWVHDITNIGEEEMIVMLWANEIFDRENPDTYPSEV